MKEQRVFRLRDIHSQVQMYNLQDKGYEEVFIRGINGQKEIFLFKPFFHESPRHAILVFEIAEYLKTFPKLKVKTYLSVKPDIVFEFNNQKWAVEVETGIILKKNKQQLQNKINNLNYYYERNWFFVVTDRNIVKYYRRYGKTYTKRNVFRKINKIWMENISN